LGTSSVPKTAFFHLRNRFQAEGLPRNEIGRQYSFLCFSRFPFTLAPSYHAQARTIKVAPGEGEMELPPEEFGDVILPRWVEHADALHRVGFSLPGQSDPDRVTATLLVLLLFMAQGKTAGGIFNCYAFRLQAYLQGVDRLNLDPKRRHMLDQILERRKKGEITEGDWLKLAGMWSLLQNL